VAGPPRPQGEAQATADAEPIPGKDVGAHCRRSCLTITASALVLDSCVVTALLTALLCSLTQDPTAGTSMSKLVERLSAEAIADRDAAAADILSNWDRWSKNDLAILEKTAKTEGDGGSRARAAQERILVRKRLGAAVVTAFPKADLDVQSRDAERAIEVLLEALALVKNEKLREADVATAAACFADAEWSVQLLDQFAERVPSGSTRAFLPLPQRLLSHSDVGIRRKAVALCAFDNPFAIAGHRKPAKLHPAERELLSSSIAPLIGDDDVRVQGMAVEALRALGGKPSAQHLRILLRKGDAITRVQALDSWESVLSRDDCKELIVPLLAADESALALYAMDPLKRYPDLAGDVAKLLDSTRSETRAMAILALGWMGARQYAKRIADFLDDRGMADQALVQLGAVEYEPRIAARLQASDDHGAAWTLAMLAARGRAAEIAKLLNSEDASRRESSARALGILRALEHADAVSALLKDSDGAVRTTALTALGHLGSGKHIDILSRHLVATNQDEAANAALSIARIITLGAAHHDVKDAISKVAMDQDRPIAQRAARVALLALTPGTATEQAKLLADCAGHPKELEVAHEVLTWIHQGACWKTLTTPHQLGRDLHTPDDLRAIFAMRGITVKGDFRLWARLPKGVTLPLIDLLHRVDGQGWLVDGATLTILPHADLPTAWRKNLEKK